MGDLTKNPKSPPSTLPPGFRFHPSDHQILSFHLPTKNKIITLNPNHNHNHTNSLFPNVIPEIDDLYNYDPYDLPEIDSFPYGFRGSKKHWYYFSVIRKGLGKRRCKGGFWKRKCRSMNVREGGGNLIGTKTSFVFYRKDLEERRCCRTNWIMIEYALVDQQMDFFVLCRVFLKALPENSVLKASTSSQNPHTEAMLTAKDNSFADIPCTQQEIPSASGIGEVVAARDDTLDNDAINFPQQLRPTTELDNNNNADEVRPFYDCSGIGSSLGMVNGMSFDDVVAAELRSNTLFLEGDYLELDDLVGPLLDFGS